MHKVCSKINSVFESHHHHKENAHTLFLYDDDEKKYTFLHTHHNNQRALIIYNSLKYECIHYCVDGGLITYGQTSYGTADTTFNYRCDSLLLTENYAFLIELKFNIKKDTDDTTKWKEFQKAMNQIKDFFQYLNLMVPEFCMKYSNDRIIPYIGISFAPHLHKKRNSQRNTQRAKFKEETGLKIRYGKELDIIDPVSVYF